MNGDSVRAYVTRGVTSPPPRTFHLYAAARVLDDPPSPQLCTYLMDGSLLQSGMNKPRLSFCKNKNILKESAKKRMKSCQESVDFLFIFSCL